MEISEYDYKITNTNENFESDLVSLVNMNLFKEKQCLQLKKLLNLI